MQLNISRISSEEVRWILKQVVTLVGADIATRTPPPHLSMLRRELSDRVRSKLESMPEKTLQRIGSYGLGFGNDGYWEFGDDNFLEEAQLQTAGLTLKAGMSGNEFLREVAFTTIVALTWDILHQAEYWEAEHRRRRSYALA